EIKAHFGYKNTTLVEEILDILVRDRILQIKKVQENVSMNIKFQNGPNSSNALKMGQEYLDYAAKVTFYGEDVIETWTAYADRIPASLKDDQSKLTLTKAFSEGANLWNWDEILGRKAYDVFRESALVFARKELNNLQPQKFLHAGCFNGMGTSALWVYYLNQGYFQSDTRNIEIIGFHPNEDLIRIAEEEFAAAAKLYTPQDVTPYKDNWPKYVKKGDLERMPFEDEAFDVVYTSQIFQWTQGDAFLRELVRVTKPGGLIFGDITFMSAVGPYLHLHFSPIDRAKGYFDKETFLNWATNIGVSKIQTATLLTLFKITK
ncbi:MAG: methyltransferase domain-containing protein, partial [Candidatus Hodarchaeota archaeon]